MVQHDLLVLDDERTVGNTVALLAGNESFRTSVTTTAEEFFAALETSAPACIVLDLIMPVDDGVKVLQTLAMRGCRSCVLIISGAPVRVIEAAANAGLERGLDVIGHLAKPFVVEELRYYLKLAASRWQNAPDPGVVLSRAQHRTPPDEAMLQAALAQDEISVVFQPQVGCRDGSLIGFEALARWWHPEEGLILPDVFIPAMEQAGLMAGFTLTVAEKAMRWFAGLGQQATGLNLSINVSARNLTGLHFPEDMEQLCGRLGVKPTQIILELTESAALGNVVQSATLLARLRLMGFRVSIDDFGSGYSSLMQLTRLPFSEIKIDKAFVGRAGTSREAREVVLAILKLSRSLGLTSVAEGVEDRETLQWLDEQGCDYAQGFLISRPMPGDDAVRWMDAGGTER